MLRNKRRELFFTCVLKRSTSEGICFSTGSPLYDVNPDLYGEYLSLNVDSDNSNIDFDLAVEAAEYYGVDKKQAVNEVELIKDTVKNNWRKLAKKYAIGKSETDRYASAFRLCE